MSGAPHTPLAGRVALVTGGAVRLGRAISLALAGAGADVVFSYHSSGEAAAATAAAIRGAGRRALPLPCDLRRAEDIDLLLGRAVAEMGPIDLLVANAGVFRRTPIETATDADWDWHMETNARAVYLLARRLGQTMRARSGAIVVVADVAGLTPWPAYIPYSASKAAAVSLTQGLALALAPEVRVNAVAPGPVLPPAAFDDEGVGRAAARTLLGRTGTADDIAAAVLYLATAPYVTGVVLPVDGGRHLL